MHSGGEGGHVQDLTKHSLIIFLVLDQYVFRASSPSETHSHRQNHQERQIPRWRRFGDSKAGPSHPTAQRAGHVSGTELAVLNQLLQPFLICQRDRGVMQIHFRGLSPRHFIVPPHPMGSLPCQGKSRGSKIGKQVKRIGRCAICLNSPLVSHGNPHWVAKFKRLACPVVITNDWTHGYMDVRLVQMG